MQYLLTEEEYRDLKAEGARARAAVEIDMQALCCAVAECKPVQLDGEEEAPQPWGCVLNRTGDYCDHCPVKAACPNENKQFSK